jgi:hypothetical protein
MTTQRRELLRSTLFIGKPMVLSDEEHAMVKDLRALRAAEAAPKEPPAELLEHGWVTFKQAAELLEFSDPKQKAAFLNRSPDWVAMYKWGGTHGEGIPLVRGRLAISEVLREWKRLRKEELHALGAKVVGHISVRGRRVLHPEWGERYSLWNNELKAYGHEEVARDLNISKAAAKRLMESELFSMKLRHYRVPIVTKEELEAYKRKLAAAQPKASPPRVAMAA